MFQDLDFANLWHIISKPDNVPVLGLYPLLIFFAGWGILQAITNDRRRREGKPLIEEEEGGKAQTWPYLTRIEFLALIIVMILLTVWAIAINAPLEEAANPTKTPNPSKAPWYFLGLQEMLVYFDPWLAGVVIPGLIVLGLIIIPYVDTNPKGSGYYTLRERPFAIFVFFFGFFVMWCAQVFIGTFLRGPGWNLFGPLETWDPHKVVFANNVDLSNVVAESLSSLMATLGFADTTRLQLKAALDSKAPLGVLFGAVIVLGYLSVGPMSYFAARRHIRRREIVDPETNTIREDAETQAIDHLVGTNPQTVHPIGLLIDLFLWTLKIPTMIVLGLLRVPSRGKVGFVIAAVGALLFAWRTFAFSLGGLLFPFIVLYATLWLRKRENWERVRRALMERVPQGVIQKVQSLGLIRYAIVSGLFLIMFGIPAKMVLRWTLSVKYLWVVPGVFNI